MRKVLLVAVITVVVLFGGLLIAPSFVDWNIYKGQVTNQVRASIGRDLAVDGDLSLTLIPRPTLVATGVRVGNIEGASAQEMIRLRTALIRVALPPLLRGQIAMDSVVLVQPQISLERLADGRVNWAFAKPADELAATGAIQTPPASDRGFALPQIAFNNISIENGTIVFRDAGTGDVRRFERINATVAAGSLQGPFRAEGTMNAVGRSFGLRAEVGRLVEDRAIPVGAGIDLGGLGLKAEFSGVLSGFPIEPRLSGRLTGAASNPGKALGGVLGVSVPALSDTEVAFAGDLTANPVGFAVSGIELALGDSNATGSIDFSLEPAPSASIAIGVSRLDLDSILAPATAEADGAEVAQRSAGEAPIQVVPGARSAAGFTLPQDIGVAVEAAVDAIIYRGSIIRQARLAGELINGELTISQASAQLPGGADVTLFGFAAATDDEPVFDGQIEANADNLRGLLSWLNISTDSVPADRLRKMELTADIRATPAQLTISNTDAQIDLSRVRGGVAVALRERPGLGIGFSIDKLNLDAYLAAPAPQSAPTEPAPTEPTDETADAGEGAEPAPGIDLSGLAFLDTFDSIMQFQIGSLTYKRTPIQGINFDGTLQGGTLELRQASVVDLAGTTLSGSGKLTDLGSASPSLNVDISLDSEDAGRFLEALGMKPPDRSGPVKISATVAGGADELTVATDIQLQGLNLRADGTLTDLVHGPTYDVRLDARHDSATAFVALLTGGPGTGADPGPVRITGRVVGDMIAADLDVTGKMGPGEATVRGALNDLATAPTAELRVSALYPDLQRLVRLFSPDYSAALTELGEFRLVADARYDPSGVTLSALQGAIGPVALQGDATLALGGERPRLTADLSTSEIIADWFLAPVALAVSPAAATPAARQPAVPVATPRWSSEPLDLSALQALDAEVAITAPGLSYTGYSVEKPQIMVTLDDGLLALKQLSGKAFDGDFSMSAELDAGDDAATKLLLSVTGADAAKLAAATTSGRDVQNAGSDVIGGVLELLFPVSALALQSGTMGADFALDTTGGTEFELVANLSGSGEITFTNTVVEGFDVCNLSSQLGNISGVDSILGLALSAEGGTTAINDFVGRFDITDGVANLPPQQLNADCATGQLSGSVDLPRWLVDLRANVTFPEHPDFPGVVVEEKGALDQPNVRLVNVNEVQQYLVARAAQSVLQQLIPDDIAEPAPIAAPEQPVAAAPVPEQPPAAAPDPAPVTEAPPAEETPADPFIKLLDALIKSR